MANTTGQPILGIIVPCYNEEEVLTETMKRLQQQLTGLVESGRISGKSFAAYVDDGSRDKTWEIIQETSKNNPQVKGVKLSRNFGHQGALLAGMNAFMESSDCIITIDADLQDDINVIGEMVDKFREGFHIVYGVRKKRKTDTFFKRFTALRFYKLMKWLGVDIVYNHADYRLISRLVLQKFTDFREVNIFLRGIFPLIGFPSTSVYYDRLERFAGESKYPLKKMMAFAFDGISSFSVKPLRIVSVIGLIVFLLSIAMALYSLYSYFFLGTVPGWTSITLPVYFISGIQILCIGIIGEYLGKVYTEVKARPRFIIENILQ
jgi:glycosyltransferase involved in cell wall biosynthesis